MSWKLEKLAALINFEDNLQSECFSFVREIIDLRNYIILVKRELYPHLQIEDFLIRNFRGQVEKLRKTVVLNSLSSSEKNIDFIRLNCLCFITILKRLSLLLDGKDYLLTLNFPNTAETRLHEEFQDDEGVILEESTSPFSLRTWNYDFHEECDCADALPGMQQEGKFIESIYDDERHPWQNDLKRFIDSMESAKNELSGAADCLEFQVIHEKLFEHLNFEKYYHEVNNLQEVNFLNLYLFSLCIWVTRKAFRCKECQIVSSLEQASLFEASEYVSLYV